MDIYLNTVSNKKLKQIANSNERKKDKSEINKMCKHELVSYIINEKVLDISNLDNMRSKDLDYFIDYNQLFLGCSINSVKSWKYLQILESKKYNLF